MSWYITGDPHGEFKWFYEASKITNKVIVLGDAGINYDVWFDKTINKYREGPRAKALKEKISKECKNTLFFCIHGNHEARPNTVYGYQIIDFCGGKGWIQDAYPNIIFAMDGEIYTLDDKEYIVIGGAYSVDKWYRLKMKEKHPGYNWFSDEQSSPSIKSKVEEKLRKRNYSIYGVLSHTCPYKYIPRELFLSSIDQRFVDNSTEKWLDTIEESLNYSRWWFGHFHGYKNIDKMTMLFHELVELK